jgi:hypothetical protein
MLWLWHKLIYEDIVGRGFIDRNFLKSDRILELI